MHKAVLTWFCIQVVYLWETAIEASTSCSVGYGSIGNSVLALVLQDLERKRRERLKVRMHHCRVEQDDHFPLLASNAMLGAPQETVGPPSCQGALLAHNQLGINQNPQIPLCSDAHQHFIPQMIPLMIPHWW